MRDALAMPVWLEVVLLADGGMTFVREVSDDHVGVLFVFLVALASKVVGVAALILGDVIFAGHATTQASAIRVAQDAWSVAVCVPAVGSSQRQQWCAL